MHRQIAVLILSASLPACLGCQSDTSSAKKVDPAVVEQHRERFVLAEEPDGLVSVIELRESLTPPDTAEEDAESGEPAGESTSGDAATAPAETESPAEVPTGPVAVNVIAKIGGESTAGISASEFPWEKDQATFVIVDPSFDPDEQGHGHGEDHDCPFCNKKAADAQAVVQFVGEDDRVVPVDARELFSLKLDDLIVVQGQAQLQGGVLMINAEGLYVRE